MLKFKVDEIDYTVPNFISIENYVKIYKVKDLFEDDYFVLKLVSLLTGVPTQNLEESNYEDISYIAAHILSLIPKETPPFVDRFELDGVQYGFFTKWNDLSFAEFIDMDTISTKKPEELLDLLHILAAIMYRPIINERSEHDFDIEKYNVKEMQTRSELFKKKLDVKFILGGQFFFIKFANKFSAYTQASLIPKMSLWTKVKLIWMMRRWIWAAIFRKPLDGSLSSTELVQTILRNTNTSTKKR